MFYIGLIMKFEKNSHYINDHVFWCRSNLPKHDIKLNIRKNSILENIKMEINTIYYLIYKWFLENKSLDASYDIIHYFCNILGNPLPTKNAIVKPYRLLRNKIKIFYHTLWKNEPLGLEPAEKGKVL